MPAFGDCDLTTVAARLARLRERRGFGGIFGSGSHRFELNPPLAEAEVVDFERRHSIVLPADYRWFLTRVGNGGAGPYYGLHKLGTTDEDQPWSPDHWPFVGNLAAQFPHTSAWNPLPFDPDEGWPDDDSVLTPQFEEEYSSTVHVNGAMPICHAGCNMRYWLVVNGAEAGHIWYDRRPDWRGLTPVPVGASPRTNFADWYCEWLGEAERHLGV